MTDFKDLNFPKININLKKDFVENLQQSLQTDSLTNMLRNEETLRRNVQREKEEKEAEELRRHNELVSALKEAGQNGATIIIGDNANRIQIQQNSTGATQEIDISQEFDYGKALQVLNEINGYADLPVFQDTFKENSNNIKSIIEETIKSIDKKDDIKLIKKSLNILKDLAVGAGGSLIASGIIALLNTLPL